MGTFTLGLFARHRPQSSNRAILRIVIPTEGRNLLHQKILSFRPKGGICFTKTLVIPTEGRNLLHQNSCHSDRREESASPKLLSFRPKGGICFLPREKQYYVYILASKSRVLYVGVTGFLMPRVMQHKTAEADGFSQRYKVNRLVYYETFQYVNNAIARETEIKKWRREKKVALIKLLNPTWEDLAAAWDKPIQAKKADSSLRSE